MNCICQKPRQFTQLRKSLFPYLYWKEEPHLKVDREGKLATFKVDVLFRKNPVGKVLFFG